MKKNHKEEVSPRAEDLRVTITRPDIREIQLVCPGTSYLAVNRISNKVVQTTIRTQSEGGPAKSKRNREAKDFEALFKAAQYRDRKEGWPGVHAACLRCAAVSACKVVGFKMTLAKLGIFTKADGYDEADGTPLLRIYGPEPHMWIAPVRNATGVFDLRPRPRWNPGEWELRPTLRFDAGMFTVTDVFNLIMRVGMQVGICEGRPDSKNSAGLEYGLFEIAQEATETKAA